MRNLFATELFSLSLAYPELTPHLERIASLLDYELIWEEPYNIDMQDPYELARECGIRPDSSKDFYAGIVVGEVGSEFLAGALFTTGSPRETFSFDVCVHPSYRRMGLGRKLTEVALEQYDDLQDAYPDLKLQLEVINPHMELLLRDMGMQVDSQRPNRVIMTRSAANKLQDTIGGKTIFGVKEEVAKRIDKQLALYDLNPYAAMVSFKSGKATLMISARQGKGREKLSDFGCQYIANEIAEDLQKALAYKVDPKGFYSGFTNSVLIQLSHKI